MKRIRSLAGLNRLALTGKHVTGLPWGHSPAAFVMSMQARMVLNYINRGLFLYKK